MPFALNSSPRFPPTHGAFAPASVTMQSERDPIFVDNLLWLPSVVEELLEGEAVAVDIEGVNLCRDGRISIIQVCDAQGRVFLFDITKMGSDAFIDWPGRPSLRALFENPHLMKVIFDGRADADALWYIFGVQMCNVYCLQVSAFPNSPRSGPSGIAVIDRSA